MQTKTLVSWESYAQKYDMLFQYNPFYQSLHNEVLAEVAHWKINTNDTIADIGAGTGNYSIPLAQLFPKAKIFHIDNDKIMNKMAIGKRNKLGLKNHLILSSNVDELQFEPNSLHALISINALYTFPKPKEILEKMFEWLQPGGYAILVNAGRMVNVLNWQVVLFWHFIKNYGWKRTLSIFGEGKEVSRQNNYIRKLQKNGTFWTHSHEQFCETILTAGFQIVKSKTTLRGVSDFVVAKK